MPVLLATALYYSRLQTHFPSQPVFYASALAILMWGSNTRVAAPCACWEHVLSCRSSRLRVALGCRIRPRSCHRSHGWRSHPAVTATHSSLSLSCVRTGRMEQATSNHQVPGKSCCYGFRQSQTPLVTEYSQPLNNHADHCPFTLQGCLGVVRSPKMTANQHFIKMRGRLWLICSINISNY